MMSAPVAHALPAQTLVEVEIAVPRWLHAIDTFVIAILNLMRSTPGFAKRAAP